MLTTKNYILISLCSFLTAILFCALYNQWIIIRFPVHHTNGSPSPAHVYKKEITLHYFHTDKWHAEKQELLWSDKTTKNTQQLINAWLSLLDEECVTPKKITLQTALLSHSGTMYLSFDHYPFTKEDTIFKKWMFIEGLLKTVHIHNINIQNVQFLVQHEPLIDYHLDFSMPWQSQGFIK